MREGCHSGRAAVPPEGDMAGRKGQARKRQLVGSGSGRKWGIGEERGMLRRGTSADPSSSSQACLLSLGEGGSKPLPLVASWLARLSSDQAPG